MSDFIRQNTLNNHGFSKNNGWVILSHIEAKIKRQIEEVGVPLKKWNVQINYGIKTGFNEAFIINGEKKDELIEKCPIAVDIIRPILRGRNIKKYTADFNEYIILIPFGWTNLNRGNNDAEAFFSANYSAIYDHLLSKSRLSGKGNGLFKRDDKGEYWWELRPCSYLEKFVDEKLIYIDIMTDNENDGYLFPAFSYSTRGEIILNTAYFMSAEPSLLKYIIAILNSKVGKFMIKTYVPQLQQRQYRLFQQNVESFPIPNIEAKKCELYSHFVDELLTVSQDKKSIEKKLEQMIFELYQFSPEEIEFLSIY